METDHDPTGHVWLSSSVGWQCHICEQDVRVAEVITKDGETIAWRWEHIPKEER